MQIKTGTFCPLIKKDCVQFKCAWFTLLRGTDPNTGKEIDEWLCAVASLPMLSINTANEARQTAASVDSFRNEMVKANLDNTLAVSAMVEHNLKLTNGAS